MPSRTMIESSMSPRRIGITVGVLIGIFLLSFAVTCVVLYMVKSQVPVALTERIVGSVRVETLRGQRLDWTENLRNITNFPNLKRSIEQIFIRCLDPLSPMSLEVTSVKEDNLARIFDVSDRGVVVEWSADIPQSSARPHDTVAETLMKCKADIELEPESVNIGLATTRSTRAYESLEDFLLDNEEEFDLRNIQLASVSTPKFSKHNSSCPPLKIPHIGSIQPISCTLPDHITVGMTCKFSCPSNQTLIGNDAITCLATGSWSFLPPMCSKFCPKLPPVLNGGVYPASCTGSEVARPATRCFYYCDQNYMLEGSSLTCLPTGVWKGAIPLCRKTCSPLSVPNDGSVSPALCTKQRLLLSFVCSFDCDKGFTISGSSSLRCDVNGRWSSPLPRCRKGCPLLRSPSHGSIYPAACSTGKEGREEVMEGIVCVYSCMDAYLLRGIDERMCSEGGIWTSDQPECKRICQPISLSPNMIVFPHSCQSGTVTEGTKCDLHCTGQYAMSGTIASKSCLEDGTWSYSDASCYRTCTVLPKVPNGAVNPSFCSNEKKLIPEGTQCNLECSHGFFLSGSDKVLCSSSGVWLGTLGRCLKKCEKLLVPESGYVLPTECAVHEVLQENHCEFSCKEGHTLEGLRVLSCLGDGTWAGSLPTCKLVSHLIIRQKTLDRDVCLTANDETSEVDKQSFTKCQTANGLHWWTSTSFGQLKSIVLGKCMAANPIRGSVIKLKDCAETSTQKWVWRSEDYAQSVALKDSNLYLYFGFASVPWVSLSDEIDEKALWYVVFSDNLSFFEEEFGGSCPKLKNSSTVVNPPKCVVDRYVKNKTVCQFSCLTGFKLYGFSNRMCLDGQWNNAYPTCRRACIALRSPLEGDVTSSCKLGLQDQGTICKYKCQLQHKLIGTEEVMCLSHGEWSYPRPSCIGFCAPLSTVSHGGIEPASCTEDIGLHGVNCSLSCAFPYVLKGSPTITCRSDHAWSGNWSCARGCNTPQLKNGDRVCDSDPAYEGTKCTYMCNNSLIFIHLHPPLNGTVERICQRDGLFNGSSPQCGTICKKLKDPDNGNISPFNCTTKSVVEGVICRVKCKRGFRFRGNNPELLCTAEGKWSHDDYICEEEVQFTLYNDETIPAVCGRTRDIQPGSLLQKHDFDHYKCYYLYIGSVWSWVGDMIKHVLSGLCLAVQDLSTQSFSLIELKPCDERDLAQLWDCEHEYFLKIYSKPLYMSASSEDHYFIIVKDIKKASTTTDFVWKSIPTKNRTNIGGVCNTKLKRCPRFGELPHGSINPEDCQYFPQHDGAVCNITCDDGYLLHGISQQSISVNCLYYGAWRSSVPQTVDALPPTCLKTCPPLTIPANGVLEPKAMCTSNRSVYGTACRFICNYIFKTEGSDVIVCGMDGTWSEPQPKCKAICSHIKMNPGEHSGSPYTEYPAISGCVDRIDIPQATDEDATCFYHCIGGLHKLVGSPSRTCSASRSYDHSLPECVFPTSSSINLAACPHPPGDPVSINSCHLIDTDNSTERVCANYTCEAGYKLVGESRIHCDVTDYTWPDPPSCHRVCEDIPYQCSDIYAGQTCHYECRFGKSFSHGNGILLCQDDGTYNDSIPTCVDVPDFFMKTKVATRWSRYCLITPLYHAPFLNEFLIIEECYGQARSRFLWINNYNLMHSISRLCITASDIKHGARLYLTFCDPMDPMQQWDCSTDPVNHLTLVFLADSSLVLGTKQALINYDQYYYFACLVDLTQLDNDNAMSTKWEVEISTKLGSVCAIRQNGANCPPLISFSPTGVTFSPSTCLEEWSAQGQSCNWICDLSLQSTSSGSYVRCDHGVWTSTTISCERSCLPLGSPINGILTDCDPFAKGTVGKTCHMECIENAYAVSETVRVCQWDGTWSGSDFKCAKSCPALTVPTAALIIEPLNCMMESRPSAGTVCSYSCLEGHYLTSKEAVRTCLDDGNWSGVQPYCVRVCSPLPSISHGSISPAMCSSPPLPAGTSCTVTCNQGYQIIGNGTRVCKEDGTWTSLQKGTEIETICQSRCKPLTPPQNSRVICSLNGKALDRSLAFYTEPAECRILCIHDYAILGSWIRRCGESGTWSGDDAYCYPQEQFFIFLSKENKASNVTICLSASFEDVVIKVNAADCDSSNALHRWSWYAGLLLRNSGSGKCMSISQPYAGQQLEVVKCDHSDMLQQWSCDFVSSEWFLRLKRYDLYPDFGYSSAQAVWVFDLDMFDKDENIIWYSLPASEYYHGLNSKMVRTTVCSMRGRNVGGVCSPLVPPMNGQIHPSVCTAHYQDIIPGLKCLYECNIGFKSNVPTLTVSCQENGLWSGPPPICEGFCYPFNLMPHMVIHPSSCSIIDETGDYNNENEMSGILPGGICTVSCEDGYTLQGTKQITTTCMENGQWSSIPSECRSICPSINHMQNAIATPDSCFTDEQTQGTVCALECDDGYVLDVGLKPCSESPTPNATDFNVTRVFQNCTQEQKSSVFFQKLTKLCMGDGSWSGSPVKCVSVCQPAVSPWHGQILPSMCAENLVKEGTLCAYTCDDGFMVRGDAIRVCRQGSWVFNSALLHNDERIERNSILESDEAPICERYCASALQNDSYTSVTPAECNVKKILVGTTCMTSCESNFILVGNSKTTCLRDGIWDGTPAKCIKKCSALMPIANGVVFPLACTTTSLGSGAICTFACLNDYSLVGNVAVTCNATGNWSSTSPECKKRCSPLPRIYNGVATPTLSCFGEHVIIGNVCNFTCNDGFVLEGSETAICQPDGQWDVSIPKCVRLCPAPSVVNGTVECTSDIYTWRTVCKIVCNQGLSPSSVASTSCDTRGEWNPELPECVETGIPMYIMQSLDGQNICLMEDNEGSVVRASKQDCLMSSSDSIKSYQWRWLENFNIQNMASGRCIAVHYVKADEPIITSPCDTEASLQWWECSTNNPFRLLLRDTAYSPSTYVKNSNSVVLQLWSDAHSYFSTLSLNTATFSSLCSRRPGGACPPLDDIPNGIVEPPNECKTNAVEEGQLCGYRCLGDNIILIGYGITQCLGNGVWLYPTPECVGSCPMLDETLPPHAYYGDPDCVFDPPQTSQICTALCLEGYEMRGNPNQTCLPSGKWSPRLFDCQRICPVIFGVLDGKIDPLPCRSVSCSFSCGPGYVLNGARVLTCLDNGEWDKPIPQCLRDAQFQIISLGVPSASLCVFVEVNKPAMLSKCTLGKESQLFKWIQDSNLIQHTATRLCLTGNHSRWGDVTVQFCDESNLFQMWECGVSSQIEVNSLYLTYKGASHYLDAGAENEDMKIAMEDNYYHSSHWVAKHYFSQGTICSMRDLGQCPPFSVPDRGHVLPQDCANSTGIREGLVCTVSCDDGYALEATPHATCQPDGKWTLPLPICKGVHKCEKIVLPSSDVKVSPITCKEGAVNSYETCYFSCEDGFLLVGTPFAKCLDNGIWSGSLPTCVQTCPSLQLPGNATVDPIWCLGGNNLVDTGCVFSCNVGFKMIGSSARACKGNGLWSGDDVQCMRMCSPLSSPTHGAVFPLQCTLEESNDETICQIQCEAGYGLKGKKDLRCSDGIWSDEMPTCVLLNACPKVSSASECEMVVIYDGLFEEKFIIPGTQVTVSCQQSCTIPSGPMTRTCNQTGVWNHGTPLCKKMCPPVKISYGVILRPVTCSYSWQGAGTECVSTCAKRMAPRGVTKIHCSDNGMWSDEIGWCEKLRADDLMSKPFMIRQFYPDDGTHVCLEVGVENDYVVQTAAEFCSELNLPQLWTWYSYRLIRSVSSGLCWAPLRRESGIILGLQKCNLADSGQTFVCGNILSQENKLHLITEEMQVWNSGSTVIQLTSAAADNGLNWESVVIGGSKINPFKTNKTMSLLSPVCRAMCGDVTTSQSGTFKSPGHPSPYVPDLICDWEISTPKRKIYLWLHNVDIGLSKSNEDDQCTDDYLMILDGESTSLENSNVLGRLCGKYRNTVGPFIGMHEKMMIKFFSDGTITASGFGATWDTEALPPPSSDCGIRPTNQITGRLMGGVQTNVSEVPWHASLISLHGQQHLCSATFIHPRYLITAAHCLSGLSHSSVSDYIIGYGAQYQRLLLNLIQDLSVSDDEYKLSVNSSNGATLVRIDELTIHPEFEDGIDSDIALIKISVESHFGGSVACMPPQHKESETFNFGHVESVKDYCTVAGWDSEKQGGVAGLHSVKLPVVSDHYCQEISSKSFGRKINTTSVLCAAHFDGTKQSLCDGDDGSALVCEWNQNYYVVGVASFQLAHCGKLNLPKYFVRTSTYKEWIFQNMIEVEN